MNDTVQVFDQLIIIQNFPILQKKDTDVESKKWIDEIKKLQSMYILDTRYPLNKTILVGYPTKDTYIIPMDIFLNHSTIIVPKLCINFVDAHLVSIINYLTATIKVLCNYEMANELKFKCIIYLPSTHKDHDKLKSSPFIMTYPGTHKKTSLGRILSEDHCRYEFIFKFKEDYSIIPYQPTLPQSFGFTSSGMNMD